MIIRAWRLPCLSFGRAARRPLGRLVARDVGLVASWAKLDAPRIEMARHAGRPNARGGRTSRSGSLVGGGGGASRSAPDSYARDEAAVGKWGCVLACGLVRQRLALLSGVTARARRFSTGIATPQPPRDNSTRRRRHGAADRKDQRCGITRRAEGVTAPRIEKTNAAGQLDAPKASRRRVSKRWRRGTGIEPAWNAATRSTLDLKSRPGTSLGNLATQAPMLARTRDR